jgi:hypothetical protein
MIPEVHVGKDRLTWNSIVGHAEIERLSKVVEHGLRVHGVIV